MDGPDTVQHENDRRYVADSFSPDKKPIFYSLPREPGDSGNDHHPAHHFNPAQSLWAL